MNEELRMKKLCEKYGIRPSKKLGQSFLIDTRIARIMTDAANLGPGDCVVEVGPGFGALTVELAARAKHVLAVEADQQLYRAAQKITEPYRNVEIIHDDILKISNAKFQMPNASYKAVASLPYSITSVVLRKFTEYEPRPLLVVVLTQKEVAERVCARAGEMSVLSVAIQYYGQPEIIAVVPRSAFWPKPEVESAILRIRNYESGRMGVDEERLFQLVRIGFSSRRKQLQNNLSAGLRLPREVVQETLRTAGLDPQVRAQQLSVQDWIALTAKL